MNPNCLEDAQSSDILDLIFQDWTPDSIVAMNTLAEMPDLRATHKENSKKRRAVEEIELIEQRLGREEAIQDTLHLAGIAGADGNHQLSFIEKTAREIKRDFRSLICKLTALDSLIEDIVDASRDHEKSFDKKPKTYTNSGVTTNLNV